METPHDAWPDVTPEELADARQYTIGIDWSPDDEVYIASFPDVPFVRAHGAPRDVAVAQGEVVIIAWLTGMQDAGYPVTPPEGRA